MKLSKAHRESIVNIVIEKVFKARGEKLAGENKHLAKIGYDSLYPEAIQRKMNALPAEFFNQKSEICLNVGGERKTLNLGSSRKISARDSEWRRPMWEEGGKDPDVIKYFVDKGQLEADKNRLEKEIVGLLAGITTVAKLQEIWPEGVEYYKWLIEPQTVKNPLMVKPDAVNHMILSMGEV